MKIFTSRPFSLIDIQAVITFQCDYSNHRFHCFYSSTDRFFPWLKSELSRQSIQSHCISSMLGYSVISTFERNTPVACDRLPPTEDDGLPTYEDAVSRCCNCEICPPSLPSKNCHESNRTKRDDPTRRVKLTATIPRIGENMNDVNQRIFPSDEVHPPSYESVVCHLSLYSETGKTVVHVRDSFQLLPTIPEDENVL